MGEDTRRAFSTLTAAGAALVVIAVLHILDHIRQGADLGFIAALAGPFQLASALAIVFLAARGNRWAPPWAIVFGFFGPVGLIASHVLPYWWGPISYSYPQVGVDAASWGLLAVNAAADLAVALTGLRALRAMGSPARAPVLGARGLQP
jgi:hypothetical protein